MHSRCQFAFSPIWESGPGGKWETLDSTGNRLLEQFQNLIFITNFIKFNVVSFLFSQQALIENMHIESTNHGAERATQNLHIHGLQLQTGKNNVIHSHLMVSMIQSQNLPNFDQIINLHYVHLEAQAAKHAFSNF
jgi:hypothetical protein